jgi:hypothetical protein
MSANSEQQTFDIFYELGCLRRAFLRVVTRNTIYTQRLRCQYLYFCTSRASKVRTWWSPESRILACRNLEHTSLQPDRVVQIS